MSAPHYLEYAVLFNGNKISSFDLDVDQITLLRFLKKSQSCLKQSHLGLMLKSCFASVSIFIMMHQRKILCQKIIGIILVEENYDWFLQTVKIGVKGESYERVTFTNQTTHRKALRGT